MKQKRNNWTYKGCTIVNDYRKTAILVSMGRGRQNQYRHDVWAITFPDQTWCICGSKKACRAYIDHCIGSHGVENTPHGVA